MACAGACVDWAVRLGAHCNAPTHGCRSMQLHNTISSLVQPLHILLRSRLFVGCRTDACMLKFLHRHHKALHCIVAIAAQMALCIPFHLSS